MVHFSSRFNKETSEQVVKVSDNFHEDIFPFILQYFGVVLVLNAKIQIVIIEIEGGEQLPGKEYTFQADENDAEIFFQAFKKAAVANLTKSHYDSGMMTDN